MQTFLISLSVISFFCSVVLFCFFLKERARRGCLLTVGQLRQNRTYHITDRIDSVDSLGNLDLKLIVREHGDSKLRAVSLGLSVHQIKVTAEAEMLISRLIYGMPHERRVSFFNEQNDLIGCADIWNA